MREGASGGGLGGALGGPLHACALWAAALQCTPELSALPAVHAQSSRSLARLWRSSSSAIAARACTRCALPQPRPARQAAAQAASAGGRWAVCAATHRTPVLSITASAQSSACSCCAGLLLCEVQRHGGCASGCYGVAQPALAAAVAQPSAGISPASSPHGLPCVRAAGSCICFACSNGVGALVARLAPPLSSRVHINRSPLAFPPTHRCALPTLGRMAASAARPTPRTSSSWAACRAGAARRS